MNKLYNHFKQMIEWYGDDRTELEYYKECIEDAYAEDRLSPDEFESLIYLMETWNG